MTDAPWKIICADVRDGLKQLADKSVQMFVTSPPYYFLRSYGIAPTIWDEDPTCPHEWAPIDQGERCGKCAGWRGDLSLEPSPEDFYRHLMLVFREVKRVLRDDGCGFINMGDSFFGNRSFEGSEENTDGAFARLKKRLGKNFNQYKFPSKHPYLKPKDLLMQGFHVANELQKDGWFVRMDIVWARPNPQRGLVTDRPIKSHEFIFLVAKNERYFYDVDAVRTDTGSLQLSVWTFPSVNFVSPIGEHFAAFSDELPRRAILAGSSEKGACVKCGAPWKRIVELGDHDLEHQKACGGSVVDGTYKGTARKEGYEAAGAQDPSVMKANILARMRERKTVGWEPTCACACTETRPCTVLDIFVGTGTTTAMARALGREGIGIDVSPENCEIAEHRTRTAFEHAKRPKREDTAQASLFGG